MWYPLFDPIFQDMVYFFFLFFFLLLDVAVEVNGLSHIRTKTINNSLHPCWNQCWRISLNQIYDCLRLRCVFS